jgi:hypothetical protein
MEQRGNSSNGTYERGERKPNRSAMEFAVRKESLVAAS